MQQENCSHQWDMVNVEYGFIITEKCFHCDKVANYFSTEDKPPLEEYREGDHFWNVMESSQSFKFDLKCTECGLVEKYDDMMGLMMCTGCHEDCDVDKLMKQYENQRVWVYVVFGFLPINERKQLAPEKLAVLEEYFNKRRKTKRSSIKFVSHEMVKDFATCYAEIIRDRDLLSLTPPEENQKT
ncbi:MAG: hypothetical protein GY757_25970 [bacterium]|nr:hypothetical protein [bacterium]